MNSRELAVTRRDFGAVAALGLLAAGCGTVSTVGGPAVQTGAQVPVAQQAQVGAGAGVGQTIQVEMGEFYYRPNTIRLRAGRRVALVFTNKGKVEHEMMAGQERRETHGYEKDFFHDLDVAVKGTEYKWHTPGDEKEHAQESGKKTAETHEEQEHGTELEVEPGGQATLTFTVPTDRKGTWEIGCFEPGHYAAGMKGTLIVE